MTKKTFPRHVSILTITGISTMLLYMTYVYSDVDLMYTNISRGIADIKEGNSSKIKTVVSFAKTVLSHSNSTGFNDSLINTATAVMTQSSGYKTTIAVTQNSFLDRLSEFEDYQKVASHFGSSDKYVIQSTSIGSSSINNSLSIMSNHKRKVILEWTTFFGTRRYSAVMGTDCPVICDVTTDRRSLSSSDAVVFHSRDMHKSDFPKSRLPHQRFILFGLESPFHFGIVAKDFNGVFNWTATYRQDADTRVTYGYTSKLNTPLRESKIRLLIKNILQNKSKLVMARISNCGDHSNRLKYVRELQKYITVDFYGACGDKPCPRSKHCNDDLPKQYKFHLSFENSICRDYITEKFWNPLLHYNSVPIAMGGSSIGDYYDVAPPHSFLHVNQFKGPEQLAEYLTALDKNNTLYEEYFFWHAHNRVIRDTNFCQLCVSLNNETLPYQQYSDLHGWFKEDVCP